MLLHYAIPETKIPYIKNIIFKWHFQYYEGNFKDFVTNKNTLKSHGGFATDYDIQQLISKESLKEIRAFVIFTTISVHSYF